MTFILEILPYNDIRKSWSFFPNSVFPQKNILLSTGYSYLGAWLPPTIYQSNWWYSQTATFSGPSNATITTIQWQLEWNVNGKYGIPPGMELEICDAKSRCQLITNPTTDGNTSYFQGESATQTFTFWFKIPTAQTVQNNPPYIGYSANSWLLENYQY